ncbi:hypothetical protein BT93_B2004 [Corymbia citriodora subsp. variegata]|nr:hypothetical protein BT93_B2004 [Corymbia citriodora subsp. variegata]
MAPPSSSPLCLPLPSLSIQPRNRRPFRLPPTSRFPGGGPTVRSRHLSSSSKLSRTVRLRCSSQRQSAEESELELERLFSNLNQATLKREPGSLSSAVFLVAGTTIGAGILAIPAVTQESGFVASAVTCIFCWIFMVATGLLVAEVNVNTMCELGSGGINGHENFREVWCASYLLVVHFHSLCPPRCLCGSFFRYFNKFSWHSTMGECYPVLAGNGGNLLFWQAVASGDLHWEALLKANFEAVPMSIPIIALSFVYQNVVPVLCTNLEGDLTKIRTAIVLGTAIPLGLFLVWNAVILGTITSADVSSDNFIDPLQQLRSSNGVVGPIIEVFSLLAIATSYIGFVLGLSDFLADLLKLPAGQSKPLPYLLTLVPPLILSLLDPEIFFKALDFAGTYGVLVLFGILPAAMSWLDRRSNSITSMRLPKLVPGGQLTLAVIGGGAGWVILSELLENLGKT